MLTIKEAADKLGVHWQTVRNHIDKGDLKAYKIGRLIKIQEDDLQLFIDRSSKTPQFSDANDSKNLSSSQSQDIEYELRYRVKNLKDVETKLLQIGAKVTNHMHIIDHWFIPINIKSRESHDIWFDQKRGCAIRIREQDNSYSGKVVTSLETKRLTSEKNHNTILENSIPVENYKDTKKLLEMMDKKEFLTIDKSRLLYTYKNFHVEIDDIKGFGTGVSIEIHGVSERDIALKALEQFAKKIGPLLHACTSTPGRRL